MLTPISARVSVVPITPMLGGVLKVLFVFSGGLIWKKLTSLIPFSSWVIIGENDPLTGGI